MAYRRTMSIWDIVDLSWPEKYQGVIPQEGKPVVDMRRIGMGSNRGWNSYFYLGKIEHSGIAVFIRYGRFPFEEECYSLQISEEELDAIKKELTEVSLGAGPTTWGTDGSVGSIVICPGGIHEVRMRWDVTPAESWSGVFVIVDRIASQTAKSPERREWHPPLPQS